MDTKGNVYDDVTYLSPFQQTIDAVQGGSLSALLFSMVTSEIKKTLAVSKILLDTDDPFWYVANGYYLQQALATL